MGSESNFDVKLFSADQSVVLNWNLTPISLPLLVRASFGSFFAINKIAIQAINTPARALKQPLILQNISTYQQTPRPLGDPN